MSQTNQVWFGMKVTPEQKQKIKCLADREGLSAKEAVLNAVDRALGSEGYPDSARGSFLEGLEDLVGSVGTDSGPTDLASNPKHLEGLGK